MSKLSKHTFILLFAPFVCSKPFLSDREEVTWKKPMLAQKNMQYSSLNEESSIFANADLPLNYNLNENKGVFVANGKTNLADKIQKSYELVYEISNLTSFEDDLATVKPYLNYALGMSRNVKFFEVDHRKLKNLENVKFQNIGVADEDMVKIYSTGVDSRINSRLRQIEFNFEMIVSNAKVWYSESVVAAFEMIKNIQRALRNIPKQYSYLKQAGKYARTNPDRLKMLQAVILELHTMANTLNNVGPILDGLMSGIGELKSIIKTKVRNLLIAAQDHTKAELKMSKDQDRENLLVVNSKIYEFVKSEFESHTDALKLTKLSLREVDAALTRISENLQTFEAGLKFFKKMIKRQRSNFETIKSTVNNCNGFGFEGEKCTVVTNIHQAKQYFKNIQTVIFQAGIDYVVLARMYNTFNKDVKKYPVDYVYDSSLGIQKNMKKFGDFVQNTHSLKSKMNRIDDELANVNSFRELKGFALEIDDIVQID